MGGAPTFKADPFRLKNLWKRRDSFAFHFCLLGRVFVQGYLRDNMRTEYHATGVVTPAVDSLTLQTELDLQPGEIVLIAAVSTSTTPPSRSIKVG